MKKKFFLGAVLFLIVTLCMASSCFAVFGSDSLNLNSDTLSLVSSKMKEAKNVTVFESNQKIEWSDETVNGNVFLLGQDVILKKSVINGDLFVAAQNVEIGEDVVINGSAFVAVANAKVNGAIERDLYIAGSDISFGEKSNVGYDVYAAAEHISISGMFERSFNAAGTDIEVKEGTVIAGTLDYASEKEATFSKDASVGEINFSKQVKPKKTAWDMISEYILDFVRYFVVTMVVLIVVIKKLPRFLEKMGEYVSIGSFGAGILGLIVVPIITILLFVASVTTTVAWALIAFFIFILIVSMAITNVAIAKLLESKMENIKLPIWTAIVTALSWIVYQIPIAGGILAFIWVMMGLGICVRHCFAKNVGIEEK